MVTDKKVNDLMIPLEDYPHIPHWFTLRQAMAIAQGSRQVTTAAGFGYGWVPTLMLMEVLARFVSCNWPLMSLPVLAPKLCRAPVFHRGRAGNAFRTLPTS